MVMSIKQEDTPTTAGSSACSITLAVNGEIYNHRELKKGLQEPHEFQTMSDCEVLLPLYLEEGLNFVHKLRGIFAFVLHDGRDNSYVAVRDYMGIIPLYIGWANYR